MIEYEIKTLGFDSKTAMKRVDRLNHALLHRDQVLKEARKLLKIKAPEPAKVRTTTISDRFNHSRTNQNKPTTHYFTDGRRSSLEKTITNNPFKIEQNAWPLFQNQTKAWNVSTAEHCRYSPLCSNPCLCSKKLIELSPNMECDASSPKKNRPRYDDIPRRRLDGIQVEDDPLPPNKIDSGDPDYFESTKGRPLKETFKKFESSQMQRTIFFKTLLTGHLNDEFLKQKEKFALDMTEIEETSAHIDCAAASFEQFISHINTESANLVEEQMFLEREREMAAVRLERHRGVIKEAKDNLYRQENRLSKILACRDFLLKLSPTSFQQRYAFDASNSQANQIAAQRVADLFDEYCRHNPNPEKDVFLAEGIDLFIRNIKSLAPPRIYFKHHWEFTLLLREMENVCSRQVAELASINIEVAKMEYIEKEVNVYFKKREHIVDRTIEQIQEAFADERVRAAELVDTVDVETVTTLKEAVSGDVVLETYGLVANLFYDVVGEGKTKLTVIEMMEIIEHELSVQETIIANMVPGEYAHYEKKVKDMIRKEEIDGHRKRQQMREFIRYGRRTLSVRARPLVRPTWKTPKFRSPVPQFKGKKIQKNSIVKQADHLQLEGICLREDDENQIDYVIHRYLDRDQPKRKWARRSNIFDEDSSEGSTVSTNTLHRALPPKSTGVYDGRPSTVSETLEILELDYDSQEELLEENYEMMKSKKLKTGKRPSVLYKTVTLNDKFMVPTVAKSTIPKDRKHTHRPEVRPQRNPLNCL